MALTLSFSSAGSTSRRAELTRAVSSSLMKRSLRSSVSRYSR
jgi:hypothetical protein